MTRRHVPAPTTHTLELEQLQQLNDRLIAPHDPHAVTAAALGLAGEQVVVPHGAWSWDLAQAVPVQARRLPGIAVLEHVSAEGPPSFPYFWGHFRTGGSTAAADASGLLAPLHTECLYRLGIALGLHLRWGV